jgi:acylphosphatase
MASSEGRSELLAWDFHVTGKVQGVFFRKYTQAKAAELKVTGWVKNEDSRDDLVLGHAEGSRAAMQNMKRWLSTTGSPKSRIVDARFSNERAVSAREFPSFEVRKGAAGGE